MRNEASENLGRFGGDLEVFFRGGLAEPKAGGVLLVPDFPVLYFILILDCESFGEFEEGVEFVIGLSVAFGVAEDVAK